MARGGPRKDQGFYNNATEGGEQLADRNRVYSLLFRHYNGGHHFGHGGGVTGRSQGQSAAASELGAAGQAGVPAGEELVRVI